MTGREPTLEQRVATLERDARDHAKTLTAHNGLITDVNEKVSAIEAARQDRLIFEARREEKELARSQAVNERFDRVEDQLKAIKDNGNKVVFIVLTAVIGAVVLFMMKGGFYIK